MTAPVDTAAVRAAVSACPGVVRVHGRGTHGVSADGLGVEVHVVARFSEVLPDLATRVDTLLAPLLGGRTLTLVVDDLADPAGAGDPDPADPSPSDPHAAHPADEPGTHLR